MLGSFGFPLFAAMFSTHPNKLNTGTEKQCFSVFRCSTKKINTLCRQKGFKFKKYICVGEIMNYLIKNYEYEGCTLTK